jgi:TRAP transporter TAXI family solute receptor
MPGSLGGVKLVKHEKIIIVLIVMSILLVAALTLGCATVTPTAQPGNATPTSQPTRQYSIATGGVAGTYYPIGTGIAYAVNNASAGMVMSVESTGASVANCRLLQNKSVDFALVQTDVAYSAVNGERDFVSQGKLNNIEGVACLYPETIQIITLANSGIKNVSDLKGKNIVMGDRGSGSWYNAIQILTAYGLNESDVKPSAVKLAQAAEMMKNGQVDAAFWTGGAPTAAVTDLATTSDIYIVPIEGAAREKLMNMSVFYAQYVLPANTYRGLVAPTETVTVMSMLIVNKNIATDDVYNLCKAMYDSSNSINKYPHTVAKNISKTNALVGMSVPLHAGAKKYFDEQGIKAP